MSIDATDIKAVVFDYGNTLIQFARPQIDYCDGKYAALLRELYGGFDERAFAEMRDRDRRAPYQGELHENDLATLAVSTVRALFGRTPTDGELGRILELRYEAFVDSIEAPGYVDGLLTRLHARYKLGVLSNYPCGRAIRASLSRTGIGEHIDAVVVSGDEGVGRVKPHPRPFELVLQQLGVAPREAVYVGDNWFGDVQGAKRAGMHMAFITKWDTPEKFDREAGDHDPDVVIGCLTELEAVLSGAMSR